MKANFWNAHVRKANLRKANILLAAAGCVATLALGGCRSDWIDATVENKTGQPIHELEVDYPTASFGINSVAAGSVLRYRLQIRGSGPLRVEYINQDGKTVHLEGLTLSEHQRGTITIRLLPAEKVDFLPNIQQDTQ